MPNKKPAGLNRSLRLTEAELIKYSSQLIKLSESQKLKSVTNKIINQDILDAVKYLPEKFIDLLFIDPPYNLTKKFNDVSFKEMKDAEYESWLDSWLIKLKFLLKENASIYICGDWKTSAPIFRVGSKYFQVQNRITWEREREEERKRTGKTAARISGSSQIQTSSLAHATGSHAVRSR